MDADLHTRIETLEELARQTLQAVNALHADVRVLQTEFREFRDEQRAHNARSDALFKQIGARLGGVESRVTAVEGRLSAVEDAVFATTT